MPKEQSTDFQFTVYYLITYILLSHKEWKLKNIREINHFIFLIMNFIRFLYNFSKTKKSRGLLV